MLHPGQGSLPLLSPRLDVPTFAARYLHVRNDARDPAAKDGTMGEKGCPVILPTWRLYSRH
jgi:hypothetical protein